MIHYCPIRIESSSKLKAFTLAELLVVLLIVAILSASGITALIGLRNSSIVNSQTRDFVSEAKSFLSEARGSVYLIEDIQNNTKPDAIGFVFQQENYQKLKCTKQSAIAYDYSCAVDIHYVNRKHPDATFAPRGNCVGILFEYATGDIKNFETDQLATLSTKEGICELVVDHVNISYSKTITIDAENNTITSE